MRRTLCASLLEGEGGDRGRGGRQGNRHDRGLGGSSFGASFGCGQGWEMSGDRGGVKPLTERWETFGDKHGVDNHANVPTLSEEEVHSCMGGRLLGKVIDYNCLAPAPKTKTTQMDLLGFLSCI